MINIFLKFLPSYLGSCPIRGALSRLERSAGDLSPLKSSFFQVFVAPSTEIKMILQYNH